MWLPQPFTVGSKSKRYAQGEASITRTLLIIDGIINLSPGAILAVYPEPVLKTIGIPVVELPIYASILGAVLFGIGIALII